MLVTFLYLLIPACLSRTSLRILSSCPDGAPGAARTRGAQCV